MSDTNERLSQIVGGSDILMEMYEAGELQALLEEKQVARAS